MQKIPEALVRAGLITKDQLRVAEVSQKNLGGDIGSILIKKGFLGADPIRKFLETHCNLRRVVIADQSIDPAVVKVVPISAAQKHHFMPLHRVEDLMTIAIADPLTLFALEEIRNIVKCDLDPMLATTEEVAQAIQTHYQLHEPSLLREQSLEMIGFGDEAAEGAEVLQEMAAGAKVVDAVNNLILKAYYDRASDIHVEPQHASTRIRYRVDGLLEERSTLPKSMHLPLVSRLKIMGGMDIAERRTPQDGRTRVRVMGNLLDLRLSTFPTMHGEKVVMRLLSKEGVLRLEDLGLAPADKQRFSELILHPHGMFLVTGPTGSGKTSTHYAALQRVNSQERNIISIEDPIENEIAGVNQAQINTKAGVTFGATLRSVLRQDPDIIMVGEIRDAETADIAVRAAMTGHLVFSTLHTNTAIGAVARLKDLGVQPFLIASALLGVLAQRLVRRNCPHCAQDVPVDAAIRRAVGDPNFAGPVKRGKGCAECRMSGYRGRTGIFELLTMDDTLRRMIAEGRSEDELRVYCEKQGQQDMHGDGVAKVKAGQTTVEELLRVSET
ncbi:MAG: Flp pilus assembly complex ATPase component TadA [Deltaproteobacteria bacterium]|nr:Flp pilus assembly complex ATPase component TadA [Deltaproteobacteria bacterium]